SRPQTQPILGSAPERSAFPKTLRRETKVSHMPPEQPSVVKFEIGHILFIDIVSYSKLLIHEQLEYLEKLREIVRATETFRAAQHEGKLMRLPTGDGGALVFHTSPEAPAKCAMEIACELKRHPELRVRMG